MSQEDAQAALRKYSRHSGKSMKEVAEAILLSDEIKHPLESRTAHRQ
jgi:hypothetical protein